MNILPEKEPETQSNPEWEHAWHVLHQTNTSVNLTGKAGTGKSTFIRALAEYSGKKILYTAPTGLAALNIRGVTLHSMFGLPFGPLLENDPRLVSHKLNARKKKILNKAELLVIDEISMVRADTLDAIDRILRLHTKNPEPFGGLQLLMVGDNYQLEPVVKKEEWELLAPYYSHPFYFAAHVFKRLSYERIELKTVYRQSDPFFITLLNKFRIGAVNPGDLDDLNTQVANRKPVWNSGDFSIILAPRVATASSENLMKLALIKAPAVTYRALVEGKFNPSSFPTDEVLDLKPGAQVIMVKNDKNKRWVNGTLGKIISLFEDELLIQLENGKTVEVTREVWEQIEYIFHAKTKTLEEEVVGTFIQFPVRLAWAITIHKSQGLTFNRVVLNMDGGAFAAGQLYVALSRCRSLEGLTLLSPIKRSDIIVHREALEYDGLGKYLEPADRDGESF